MNILILGIGQSLRGDDAAALEAVRLWRETYPQTAGRPELRVETCELPGLALLDLLAGAEAAILVDAVHTPSQPPGSLLVLEADDLASFTPDSQSAHGWGVAETLQLGRSLDPALAACRVTLIGIVGGRFELGEGLTNEVERILKKACLVIQQTIHGLME